MKNFKRVLSLMLAIAMAVTMLVGCGESGSDKIKAGTLTVLGTDTEQMNAADDAYVWTFYDSMDAMLLALEAGKIDIARIIPECVGKYIETRNEKMKFSLVTDKPSMLNYHMGALSKNQATVDLLDKTLNQLKQQGIISNLVAKYIDDYTKTGEEPAPVALPTFPGADTIKVAVTGDLPPLDYVSAAGVPAGFNVALLAEIAKIAEVNFEVISINAAARATAIATGSADVLFWVCTREYQDASIHEFENIDITDDLVLTSPYFGSQPGYIELK